MIRFLNASTRKLPSSDTELKAQQSHPYIILSHVWFPTEIIYSDLSKSPNVLSNPPSTQQPSASKILNACSTVLRQTQNRITHLWLDTVCIDKTNLTELSAAINSMYRYYKHAAACYVYLSDYPSPSVAHFTGSRWFTRGWTLQELVAPSHVHFFDKSWACIGTKQSLQAELTSRTKIAPRFLLGEENVGRASVAQRMSWFSGRSTTVEEDGAYALMGLFGVNMPLLYGEGGGRAFRRLQEEIMRYSDDHSIFAWTSQGPLDHAPVNPSQSQGQGARSGLLSSSPDYFTDAGGYEHRPDVRTSEPFEMTNKGISIRVFLQQQAGGFWVASIDCPVGEGFHLGVWLECLNPATQQFRRVRTGELCKVRNTGRGEPRRIYVKPLDDV